MVAADFLQDPRVPGWLDGGEPAWTLLTFESLRALRHEPSAVQTAIRIANDLRIGEIAGSPVARNTLILRVGLPLTATGNLSRAVVAEMCKLIEWPDYDQADAFRFNKVINEPDFLPLYVVRQLGRFPRLSSRLNGPVMTSKRKGPPRAKRYSHKPSPALPQASAGTQPRRSPSRLEGPRHQPSALRRSRHRHPINRCGERNASGSLSPFSLPQSSFASRFTAAQAGRQEAVSTVTRRSRG